MEQAYRLEEPRLEKIYFYFEDREYVVGFEQCCNMLASERYTLAEQEKWNVAWTKAEKSFEGRFQMSESGQWSLWGSVLYVTDSLALANKLKQAEEAVLFYVHEKNRTFDLSGFRYLIEGFEEVTGHYFEKVYQRLKKLPWTILTTKRLVLRETTVEDLPDFFQIYKDPSITKYTEDLYSYEEEEAYIRDYSHAVYEMLEYGIWTVVEKESGKIIGRAGLNVREGYEEAEIGFLIGALYQRKGYAYEACEAICQYAKEELYMDSLQAFVMEGNSASEHLLAKLGFTRKGKVVEKEQEYVQFYRFLSSELHE